MNYRKFCATVANYRAGGQRWGQAVMNAAPVEWRDELPDIWEQDFMDGALAEWYAKAEANRTD